VSSSEIILKQEFDNFETIKTRNNIHAEKCLRFIQAYPDDLARGDKKTLGAALQSKRRKREVYNSIKTRQVQEERQITLEKEI
jgi:hypothetical protein